MGRGVVQIPRQDKRGRPGGDPAKQFAFWLPFTEAKHVVQKTNDSRETYGEYFTRLVKEDRSNLKKERERNGRIQAARVA